MRYFLGFVLFLSLGMAQPPPPPPPIVPSAAALQEIQELTGKIESTLASPSAQKADPVLRTDVEVYAKAGRFLLEFPETFFTQEGIDQAKDVLRQGIDRAAALSNGQAPWNVPSGRHIRAYRSDLDGSIQPYGLTFPSNYDPSKPAPLYVWLHGRDRTLTESSFLFKFPKPNKGATYVTADIGQITLDCYGRWNNANHWAGEVDVFEAIAAVSSRYKIDPNRIVLRGFSLGGAGAWHIALQYPDRFAAAEIGAGTYPRRSKMGGFPDYQQRPLHIWENILDWSLNAFNIPIAGHDGDSDTGTATIPQEPGKPSRGQLESSLRVRAQLEREGFPSEGEPNFLRAKGTPSIFLISANTGHSISPLVRSQIDSFLKEKVEKGRTSPDDVRFVTYTTRYPRAHWVEVNTLVRHYERSTVFARRDAGRKNYSVTTANVDGFTLREMNSVESIQVDGQSLPVRQGASLSFIRSGGQWHTAAAPATGLRKRHAQQGPIDDAFLDPFLLVRPTGQPWNPEAHAQALRILERFDRVYARYYRSHPRIKDDKDVTAADMARYHLVLFGDPGSNRLLRSALSRLPVRWNQKELRVGSKRFPAADHLPALIYPSPFRSGKYLVVNSGLTIEEREYHGDYSMPRLGDIAVLKAEAGTDTPSATFAALFDEYWKLPE